MGAIWPRAFDALLAPSGLSEIEFRVLLALVGRDGSAHPGELCGSLAQSPANMTRVSDLLVERGLVTRVFSEQDRRRVVIELTAAGDALVREVLPQLFATTRTLFQDFTRCGEGAPARRPETHLRGARRGGCRRLQRRRAMSAAS